MTQGFDQSSVDAFNARRAAVASRLLAAVDAVKLAKGRVLAESEIQDQIAAYLQTFGNACHFDVARMDKPTTSRVGRPDFIGGLRGVGFAMEVKRPGHKETMEQAGELLRWQLCGFRCAVVHSLAEAVDFLTGKVLTHNRGGADHE